jgi:hypothetical protein
MRLDAAIELVSDPNAVHFGSATAFSATFIGSRWQRFMNVPCISHESDVWRNRWVRTYELRIWAPFVWDRPGESFVDVWPRRRLSTGYPNDLEIDGNLLTGYLEVLPETITDTGCYLRTYTYKVFSDPSESNCLGWYPLAVPGEGFCLNCTSNARFDYSYIGTTGFARSGAGNARPDSRKGGSMTNVDLIDVGGRVVASLETSPEKFEMALSARVRNLPSGVYFAKIMTPSGPIRGMKIILR